MTQTQALTIDLTPTEAITLSAYRTLQAEMDRRLERGLGAAPARVCDVAAAVYGEDYTVRDICRISCARLQLLAKGVIRRGFHKDEVVIAAADRAAA
jgi:hypothetical protein|tara:strand:+ start:3014 stop:3304 length:291 start_codon:yes stop_codon:yes gene_type:complete